MIKIRNNKKKTGFQNSNAINVNAKYVDEVAKINNVKKSSKKIELEEDFVMPERTDIDKNVFTNATGTKEWKNYVKSEEKNVNMVNDYASVIAAEKEFKKDYKYLAHENFKYEKRLEQEIQRHNPIKLLSDNFKQLVSAFGVSASMLNQLELVQSIARIIAPPPTAEQIINIKKRLSTLDVSILTDYYTISQIVQSEELQNFIKAMYEQFEKIANSPESKFIINLVKHVMDYIILNQNKFGMPQYLQSIYNKYFGSKLNINPGAPVVEPTNEPLTFGHDQTLAPSERITAPPTAAPTPTAAAPTSMAQAPSFNPDQVSEIIKTYYDLAYSDRTQLELFYNKMTNGTNTVPELMDIVSFMRRKTLNTSEATLTQLIQPLTDALNSLTYVSQSVKNEINNKGNNIILNGFFFQPRQTLTQPAQPQPQPVQTQTSDSQTSSTSSVPRNEVSGSTPQPVSVPRSETPAPARHHQLGSSTPMEINNDLRHIMDRFNEAFTSNITTLKLLYFNILDKKDPILNKFIVLYDTLFRLDNLYDIPQESAPGKIWIINLFNSLNNLNYPVLNDFKQMLRAKADLAMVSPNYEVSTADNSIQPVEGFTPINYVRTYRPEPSTIAQPYNVKPTTRVNAPSAPTYVSQPTTGPQIAPSPQAIMRGSNIITQKPSNIKVKITKSQATKIIETIINNSTSKSDIIEGLNTFKSWLDTFTKVGEVGGLIIAGSAALYAMKKYYSKKVRPRYEFVDPYNEEELRPLIAVEIQNDVKIPKATRNRLIELALKSQVSPIFWAEKLFGFAKDLAGYGNRNEIQQGVQDVINEMDIENAIEKGREMEKKTNIEKEKETRKRILEGYIKNAKIGYEALWIINDRWADLSNLKSSFEIFTKFYNDIQYLTANINSRFNLIGMTMRPIVALADLNLSANFNINKLKENFNKQNFRTIKSRLEQIIKSLNDLEIKDETNQELYNLIEQYKELLKTFLNRCINALK